jgi:branched-chain amino acid transport system permease protein
MLIEEVLGGYTQRWPIGLGLVLLAVVFFAPRGIAGAFRKRE